jgi:GT2 family glycosyltransferase
MTLISRTGYRPAIKKVLTAPLLTAAGQISIIIPVKNNQQGINRFVEALLKTHALEAFPGEVIIVDNNSGTPVTLPSAAKPAIFKVLSCSKPGPAAARNISASHAQCPWLLFADSDCIPTPTSISGYIEAQNGAIGYAGDVKANRNDLFSQYYQSQEILLPPEVLSTGTDPLPDYLVTANCLIWKTAFDEVGGFNETFPFAAGEDIDLGFRLRTIGRLAYAPGSTMLHQFEPGLRNFISRFVRYGKGNRIVSQLYGLNLQPRPFAPVCKKPVNYLLAWLQYQSMRRGYRSKFQ